MNKLTCCVAVALAVSLVSPSEAGAIRYVDDSAPLAGDGLSWNTAYQDVQSALNDVAQGVVLIRVAGGTYAAGSELTMSGGVAYVGGFAGFGAPDPDERDTVVHETILSGEDTYRIASLGLGNTVILDGFTFRDGHPPGTNSGGALVLSGGGDVVVSNCRFINNTAMSGGAVNVQAFVNGSFLNCVFTGNVSLSGGALSAASSTTVSLTDCVFESNSTTNPGSQAGALQITGNATLVANNCSFSSNTSISRGGACAFENNTGAEFNTCTFDLNNAGSLGGAIFTSASAPVTLNACVFTTNTAQRGGALAGWTSFEIVDSTFVNNMATELGGGILMDFGTATVINCSF